MRDKRKKLDKKIDNVKLKEIAKKQKLKEQGITLIALVVTIIILLILAGVTLNIALSDNGLFNKTKKAAEEYKEAQENEKKQMAMIMASSNNKTWYYKDGKEISEQTEGAVPIPAGFAPTGIEGESTVDEGFVITDSRGNEFVWIPVPNAIKEDGKEITNTYTPIAEKIESTENYKGILYTGWTANSIKIKEEEKYREPDILYEWDTDERLVNVEELGGIKAQVWKEQMQKDYNEMVKSVEKNGGFFIARYEMSYDAEGRVQHKKGEKSDISNKEANQWYEFYKKQKEFANDEAYGTDLKSSMIWGSQYDAMLNWMYSCGIDLTYKKERNDKRITGINENDKFKNVYDLMGNSYEWTLTASDKFYRSARGGRYDGLHGMVDYIDRSPIDSNATDYSSRSTIYVVDNES